MTADTRAALTELPLDSMIGMRNRLWTTVTEAAPPLVERISKLLEED